MRPSQLFPKFVYSILRIMMIIFLISLFSFAPNSAYAALDEPLDSTTLTTVIIRSTGEYDGWTEEASENANFGTSAHNRYEDFWVGDGPNDEQYRGILSFNTSSLPDNKTVTSATLKVKYSAKLGTLPFTTHNGLYLDVKTPAFGTPQDLCGPAVTICFSDFEAAATKLLVAKINSTPVDGWYSATIPGQYISKTSTTQFRFRFAKDDNDDNSPDRIGFFQGDASVYANRPRLIVRYIP